MSSIGDVSYADDSTDAAPAPVVKIKKRGLAGATAARKTATIDAHVFDETETSSPATTLDDIKLLQKSRTKAAGVSSAPAYLRSDADAAVDAPASPAGPASAAGTSTVRIDKQFRADGSAAEAASLEAAKEAFIREQLAKARVQPSSSTNLSPVPSLEPVYSAPASSASRSTPTDTDSSESQADRWATGIAEVTLPVSEKLKNIERTEAARAAALKQRGEQLRERIFGADAGSSLRSHGASGTGSSSSVGITNISTDYQRSRSDHALAARAAEAAEAHRRACAVAVKQGLPPPPMPKELAAALAAAAAGSVSTASTGVGVGGTAKRARLDGVPVSSASTAATEGEDAWLGSKPADSAATAAALAAREAELGRLRYTRALERVAETGKAPASDLRAVRDFKRQMQ